MRELQQLTNDGVTYFVLDYLQLIRASSERDLLEKVTEISMRARDLAHDRKVVVIGLSQNNRVQSRNYADKPVIQGLFGGSPLENDADQVILLDHSRYERAGDTAKTWVVLGKNRYGPSVEIPILWDYRTLRVREQVPEEEDSVGAG